VVAIDPNNGDVIALVSRPGFDPSLFGRGLTRSEYAALTDNIDLPLFNRALRGTYPSGSTLKPAMALAGLSYGVIEPDKAEFCDGSFNLPGSRHQFREGKGGRHGYMNLKDAIAKSCDVYFYDLAATLGVDRIAAFLAPFGLGELTGIDISGEKPGLLPTPAWKKSLSPTADRCVVSRRDRELRRRSGLPASDAAATGSHDHGTGQSRPQLPAATRGRYPQCLRRARTACAGGRQAVTGVSNETGRASSRAWWAPRLGTAAGQFKGTNYSSAGKTGTAQVYTVAQSAQVHSTDVAERLRTTPGSSCSRRLTSRIAICVLVENGGFGASAAAPIARSVIDAYLGNARRISLRRTSRRPRHDPRRNRRVHHCAAHAVRHRAAAGHAQARRGIAGWPGVAGGVCAGGSIQCLGRSTGTILRTLARLGVGALAMVALANSNPNFLRRLAPWLYIVGVVLLVIVDAIGYVGKGAQRWLDLGVIRFQPSEIMKIAVPMMAAAFLHERPLPPDWRAMSMLLVIILLPAALVAVQPDLGTALLIAGTGVCCWS
jgi:hypothetical protein